MYASHRDACILSYYSSIVSQLLDDHYKKVGIEENVIAYRRLGRGNYHFSAEAFAFAQANAPVVILAFDVTGFFDNLNHALLKQRLKKLLGVKSLSKDWFSLYRYITKFHYVELADLQKKEPFATALKAHGQDPIGTIAEIKMAGIKFHKNRNFNAGIPQGTPISATLSNLYMIDFDEAVARYCDTIQAFYRRYSDDILVICKPHQAIDVEEQIAKLMSNEKLTLSVEKTEKTNFSSFAAPDRPAQYLGFNLQIDGASIRPSSLSRQWRKMKRAFKRTRAAGEKAIAHGTATKVYTKRLRRRFTPLQFRNFSSYGRRCAAAFAGNKKIIKQIRRFEREAARQLTELEKLGSP